MLQLVARLRQRPRDGCSGCRVIQPKISVDAASAPNCAAARGAAAHARGATPGEDVADARSSRRAGRRDAPPQRSCSFVRALAVLVRADRDVLGAVVRGELGAAQREHRRRERQQRRARSSRASGRSRRALANASTATTAPRPSTRARAGSASAASPPAARASPAAAARTPRRAAPARAAAGSHARRAEALAPRDATFELTVRRADGAGPRRRPVHEHAVRERHPAEPHLLLHLGELKRTSRYLRAPSTRR